ncbi:unnamed protein product, partial [Anisakis simplex]|uniref:Uncharacterized protein n=1 Tax=Anisakis simplex TaxID=6269 RepID=A0A0M3JM41_ANISI
MDIAAGTEDEGGRGDHVARLDTSRIDGETCDGGTNASGRSATAVSPTESMEQEWNGTNRLQTREGAAAIVPEPEQAESGKAMGLGDGKLNSAEGSEPGVSATSSGAAGMISSSFGETTEAGYGREGTGQTGRADRAGLSASRAAVGGTASNAASNTTR